MDLFEKLLSQFTAVQIVWFPFLLAVVIVGVIVWRAVDYAYQTRLTNADSTKDLLDRQLQEYREKLSGATPDEAKARMDALEARLDAMAPRQLSVEQRNEITKILDAHRGAAIEIAADAGSPDAGRLSQGLASAFRAAAWHVSTPMVLGLPHPPDSGVSVAVPDPHNLQPSQVAIFDALASAGFRPEIRIGANEPAPPGWPQPIARITLTNRLD